MKLHIDPEICAGFRMCLGIIPELLEEHPDGYVFEKSPEVPAELEDLARRAASQCPSNAIRIIEE